MARRVYELVGSSYGQFRGAKVYYLRFPVRPRFLPESGRGFAGLKHLMELLHGRFGRFELTFTPDENSAQRVHRVWRIRLAQPMLRRLSQRRFEANRQLNLRLGRQLLAEALPDHFQPGEAFRAYERGMFTDILTPGFDPRLLTPADRTALTGFVTGAMTEGTVGVDIPTAYKTKQDVQLLYLERLVTDFDGHVAAGHDEAWWQSYFSKNILFFQDNYIRRLERLNIIVAGTQFPDFVIVTSDGYLDILEIKKPGTELLRQDRSRHNFYWSTELAKAISQVENYIDRVTKHSDAIRNKLRDDHGIDLRIIKPRGLVIAGKAAEFGRETKKADDFRLLNEGLKNVQIVPYDEMSQRVKNTIVSIQRLATASVPRQRRRRQ